MNDKISSQQLIQILLEEKFKSKQGFIIYKKKGGVHDGFEYYDGKMFKSDYVKIGRAHV